MCSCHVAFANEIPLCLSDSFLVSFHGNSTPFSADAPSLQWLIPSHDPPHAAHGMHSYRHSFVLPLMTATIARPRNASFFWLCSTHLIRDSSHNFSSAFVSQLKAALNKRSFFDYFSCEATGLLHCPTTPHLLCALFSLVLTSA